MNFLTKIRPKEYLTEIEYSQCCGVKEFHGIYDHTKADILLASILCHYFFIITDGAVETIQEFIWKNHQVRWDKRTTISQLTEQLKPSAQILWMGLEDATEVYPLANIKIGEELADLIEKNKLGNVLKSPYGWNGNTGRRVRTYVWTPDWDACEKWWQNNTFENSIIEAFKKKEEPVTKEA